MKNPYSQIFMAMIILALIAFACINLTSCVTYQACKDKYGMNTDTVYVYKDTTVAVFDSTYVPADSLIGWLNVDYAWDTNQPWPSLANSNSIITPGGGFITAAFQKDDGKLKYKIKYRHHYLYVTRNFIIHERIKSTTTIWKAPIEKPWYSSLSFPKLRLWTWLLIFIGLFVTAYFLRTFRKNL